MSTEADGVTLALSVGRQPEDKEFYHVRRVRERGIVVTGTIPVDDLAVLTQVWRRRGWDIVDGLIGQALDATLVVTNKRAGDLWRKELGIEP